MTLLKWEKSQSMKIKLKENGKKRKILIGYQFFCYVIFPFWSTTPKKN